MLFRFRVGRKLRLVATRIFGDELGDFGKFGDGVFGIKSAIFNAGDELRSLRIVGTEKFKLAMVECAAKREAHRIWATSLGLNCIANSPLQRLDGRLHRRIGGDHQPLGRINKRGQYRATKFPFRLLAGKFISAALGDKHALARGTVAPTLDFLRIAHNLDARTIALLGHIGIASANHLLDGGIEFVDIGRSEQFAAKSTLCHAIEIPLRRFALDFLAIVIIAKMCVEDMGNNILFFGRSERANLALEKAHLALRRHLKENRLGIVEEELRQIPQLVSVGIALKLADDRPECLGLRQNFYFRFQRLDSFAHYATAIIPALVEYPRIGTVRLCAFKFVSGRTAIVVLLAKLTRLILPGVFHAPKRNAGALARPVRGEIK